MPEEQGEQKGLSNKYGQPFESPSGKRIQHGILIWSENAVH
jgi:hypothetical protein